MPQNSRERKSLMSEHTHRKHGFTLIELSIVLVVIGLIAGGVLVGKDMIEAANMRKDMATVDKLDAAIMNFTAEYNALPGDLLNPTQFGFDANAYGDGNGKIQGINTYSSMYHTTSWGGLRPEWFYVAHHLGQAGLIEIPGNYIPSETAFPQLAGTHYLAMASNYADGAHDSSGGYKPGIIVAYENNNRVQGHYFRLGAVPYAPSLQYLAFTAGFTPARAMRFDNKFDDGMPVSGRIQIAPLGQQCSDDVYDTSSAGCKQGGISDSATWYHCAVTSNNDYDTGYNIRSCSLRVKASF